MAKKLTQEFVKTQIEMMGYTLISNYVGSIIPLSLICPKGHQIEMRWNNISQGARCLDCAGKRKKTDEEINEFIESFGYQKLTKYINCSTPMGLICAKGHEIKMKLDTLKTGARCRICSGSAKKTEQEVSEFIKSLGYTNLSKYKSNKTLLDLVCPNGHKTRLRLLSLRMGQRCGECYRKNFYANNNYKYPAQQRLVGTLTQFLKKRNSTQHWRDFYTTSQIKILSEKIDYIYLSCPKGFAVDHIIPVSWFELTKPNELEACWNPANLRHLNASVNMSRGNRATSDELDFMKENYPEVTNNCSQIAAFRLGAIAGAPTDRFIYDGATGALFFDVDGNGASAQVQFAQLTPGLALTGDQIVAV